MLGLPAPYRTPGQVCLTSTYLIKLEITWIYVVCICIAKIKLFSLITLIAQYPVRRCMNLFRYYYLCLMSTNCLCEHARARVRARACACAQWMQVGLTTLEGAWSRRPVRTLRPHPHLRPRPRVVYPYFVQMLMARDESMH